jgi:hypothetical protein
MTHTQTNIGIRRYIRALGEHRNFEPGGSTTYVVNKAGGLHIEGTTYNDGDALPLGVLPDSYLEILFNAGNINPQS